MGSSCLSFLLSVQTLQTLLGLKRQGLSKHPRARGPGQTSPVGSMFFRENMILSAPCGALALSILLTRPTVAGPPNGACHPLF